MGEFNFGIDPERFWDFGQQYGETPAPAAPDPGATPEKQRFLEKLAQAKEYLDLMESQYGGGGEAPDPISLPRVSSPEYAPPTEKDRKRAKRKDILYTIGEVLDSYSSKRAGGSGSEITGGPFRKKLEAGEEAYRQSQGEADAENYRRLLEEHKLNLRQLEMQGKQGGLMRAVAPSIVGAAMREPAAPPDWRQKYDTAREQYPGDTGLHRRILGGNPPGGAGPADVRDWEYIQRNYPGGYENLGPEQQRGAFERNFGLAAPGARQPDYSRTFAERLNFYKNPDVYYQVLGDNPTPQQINEWAYAQAEQDVERMAEFQSRMTAPPPGPEPPAGGYALGSPSQPIPSYPTGQAQGPPGQQIPNAGAQGYGDPVQQLMQRGGQPQGPDPTAMRAVQAYQRLKLQQPQHAEAMRRDIMEQYGVDPEQQ